MRYSIVDQGQKNTILDLEGVIGLISQYLNTNNCALILSRGLVQLRTDSRMRTSP